QLRLSASTGRLLQEVVVRGARPDDDSEARRVSLHGTPDATIKLGDKAGTYANVYEMIAGRVPGVQVNRQSPTSDGYSVLIRGPSSSGPGGNEPLYLLDGTVISGSTLLILDPHTIDRIELIKNGGGAMYGARGGAGIIAFYSKKWDGKPGPNLPKLTSEVVALGYAAQRQFYQPRYEAAGSDDKKEVDRRDVLYWQPLLLTDSQGQVRLSFPKSDVVQRIRITVQGVSSEGRPVYINQLLNVR
ncbi:MAG TPA: Plug domain-containing protein, partial [Fibrella sp.]